MRQNRSSFFFLSLIASAVLLAGCASTGPDAPKDLPTSSDQTNNQTRARIRLQLALGYYGRGELNVALDEIKQALMADPDFADAYSMRALIYMDMGENRLAEENFLHALRLVPNSPDFNNNYGWFLCQTGRERDSIARFEAAFKSRAYRSPAKALNNAGVCSLRLKDRAAAERYFTQAFQDDPGNPSTNVNLAKLYYDQGDYERAHFYVSRVLKADVTTPDVLWLAIRIERKRGDRAAETDLVKQLQRKYPESSEYAAFQRGAFDE